MQLSRGAATTLQHAFKYFMIKKKFKMLDESINKKEKSKFMIALENQNPEVIEEMKIMKEKALRYKNIDKIKQITKLEEW